MTSTLSEYKEFPQHQRFIAQLARDFIDLGKPGEFSVDMVPEREAGTHTRSGLFDQVKSVRVVFYENAQPDVELDDEEIEQFSPGYIKERLSLVNKPSVADLEADK